jgi:hypothetical protein
MFIIGPLGLILVLWLVTLPLRVGPLAERTSWGAASDLEKGRRRAARHRYRLGDFGVDRIVRRLKSGTFPIIPGDRPFSTAPSRRIVCPSNPYRTP